MHFKEKIARDNELEISWDAVFIIVLLLETNGFFRYILLIKTEEKLARKSRSSSKFK